MSGDPSSQLQLKAGSRQRRRPGVGPTMSEGQQDAGRFRSVPTSPTNRVYVLGRSVIKIYDDPLSYRPGRERAALLLLEAAGLCVPKYQSCGQMDDGRPWLMMSRQPGSPPSDALHPGHELSPELALRIGREAAHLHNSVCPPGFGTWTRDPDISLIGEQRTRSNRVLALAKQNRYVQPSIIQALSRALGAYEGSLKSAPERPVLVHRDLQPRNVLVDDSGEITGVVDFEASGGGDGAEDFSRFALDWDSAGFRAFSTGYRIGGGTLGTDAAERVTYYTLYWAGLIISYVAAHFPEYLEPACRLISRVADGELPVLEETIDLRDHAPSLNTDPSQRQPLEPPNKSRLAQTDGSDEDVMANLGLFGSST